MVLYTAYERKKLVSWWISICAKLWVIECFFDDFRYRNQSSHQ